jgi:hypothetical protein
MALFAQRARRFEHFVLPVGNQIIDSTQATTVSSALAYSPRADRRHVARHIVRKVTLLLLLQ